MLSPKSNSILYAIALTCLINVSTIWTLNVNANDGYDLERGPVFYEAYYPDNNENNDRTSYHEEDDDEDNDEDEEKRYFDRDAVIERTFQIPNNAERKEYIEDGSKNDYPLDRLEHSRYDGSSSSGGGVGGYVSSERKFSTNQNYPRIETSRVYERGGKLYEANRFSPNYVERIRNNPEESLSSSSSSSSSLLLPSSRDLENWNSLDNTGYYLRHDPSHFADLRKIDERIDPNSPDFRAIPERYFNGENVFRRVMVHEDDENYDDDYDYDDNRRKIESMIRKDPSSDRRSSRTIMKPSVTSMGFESIERVPTLRRRDLRERNAFLPGIQEAIPRQRGYRYFRNANEHPSQTRTWTTSDIVGSVRRNTNDIEMIPTNVVDTLPTENIYVPRPQIINYIFSKDSAIERNEKKPITKEIPTRSNDDDLSREELSKGGAGRMGEGTKDKGTKVTSIEISEVPTRHKVRHHHGEWLRDISRVQN